MKKLLTIAFLVIGMMTSAQVREYFLFSVAIDPSATIKEKSPNLVAELEYGQKWFYLKASTQILPALEGGYIDYGGGGGLNVHLGLFQKTRIYSGVRLGVIRRGGNPYPLVGCEGGVSHKLSERIALGVRTTLDKRADFEFWGGEPKNRISNYFKIEYHW